MNKIWLVVGFALCGCSHVVPVRFQVDSDPQGAVIERNGVAICDSTPCTIELGCRVRSVSAKFKSPLVQLDAIPRASMQGSGAIISKSVDPCSAYYGEQKIFFGMGAEKVHTTERVEVRHR